MSRSAREQRPSANRRELGPDAAQETSKRFVSKYMDPARTITLNSNMVGKGGKG